MNNNQLSRQVDRAKDEIQSIIDSLIAEIEELEEDNKRLQSEYDDMVVKVNNLEEELNEAKG